VKDPLSTSQSERIAILDSVRGIAILGILLMNIPIFALPGVVANDPTLLHEGTLDYSIWYTVGWIFNGTQRALFSMLFGAGIVLFIERQEKRADGLWPADYFFRRQIWLIVLSLFDVYILLWNGDILMDYACFGMLLFTFRMWSPKALMIAASVCLLFMLARENRDFYQQKNKILRGEAVAAIDTTQAKLTDLQKEQLEEMQGIKSRNTREGKLKRMEKMNRTVQGDYATVYDYRTNDWVDGIVTFTYLGLWDVLLCFFFGMAFFKTGVITGQASVKVYAWMTVVGLSVGLTLSYIGMQQWIDSGFNGYQYVKDTPFQFYQLNRIFRSLGMLGLVMLLFKSGWFNWFFSLLRPVGQMALTNYLMQSLICGLIFNGFAFGLFGKLPRHEVYLVVAAVWVFQIIFSHLWMRSFLYGPFEWMWRSLTYWKRQPFLIKP